MRVICLQISFSELNLNGINGCPSFLGLHYRYVMEEINTIAVASLHKNCIKVIL